MAPVGKGSRAPGWFWKGLCQSDWDGCLVCRDSVARQRSVSLKVFATLISCWRWGRSASVRRWASMNARQRASQPPEMNIKNSEDFLNCPSQWPGKPAQNHDFPSHPVLY